MTSPAAVHNASLLKAVREAGVEEQLKELGILPEDGEAEEREDEETGG